ncbi:MAG: ATP phosphoribosyltransferase regulatory subunit [Burkholderiaceae bacterium]|jgi:ATP phosphoribosyltransferase regulatory subunit|nr:ATP phosphoribosyltransferase regulatory subunit [Oxalobacteraceae bacterium]
MPNWLLPENVADVLPSEARKTEEVRRAMLDQFRSYGYELVAPPLLEYVESLMPVQDQDLDLRMFKLVDQLSGRTMGIRADMTIQVARIDAHLLNRPGVVRLCYAGALLHTRPSGFHSTREPLQVGAEIYGHAGLEADVEIQALALASLKLAGLSELTLDLSHVGVLDAVIEDDPLAKSERSALIGLLRAKDMPALHAWVKRYGHSVSEAVLTLASLRGGIEVLDTARQSLPRKAAIDQALSALSQMAQAATGASINIDLADLSGYQYESGVTFAIYVPGLPNAVARGGRYDEVGEAFGRARPATGFSMDLREIVGLLPVTPPVPAISAPWRHDEALQALIAQLRQQGEIVIQHFPGQSHDPQEFDCDREIVEQNGKLVIKPLR